MKRIEGTLPEGYSIYEQSLTTIGETELALVRGPKKDKFIYLVGDPLACAGQRLFSGWQYQLVPETAAAIQALLPWLKPRRIPSDRPSFGFGDRLGLATPGHIRALGKTNVFPILAQQSVRENARTGRTFAEVMASAIFGAFQEGYKGGFGADADHLKRIEDALEAADVGYTFFTCDPSDHVIGVEELGEEELRQRFASLSQADEWRSEYLDHQFAIPELGELRFTEEDLLRAAVKYGAAVEFAAKMYRALSERLPEGFDYEVSVDETDYPTSPLEHLFVARELQRKGVKLTSLAPRFVGAMEKGVDWRGDIDQFKEELHAHAAIARSFGLYRLSLHSGSDKFTLYPLIHQATRGKWHVKTAGTSYLVALDVVARDDPAFFRDIMRLSLSVFDAAKKSYHISADRSRIPKLDGILDDDLPSLVEEHDSRQVLHVGYGSVLDRFGYRLKEFLESHEEEHYAGLARHLGRHLQGLEVTDEEV